MHNYSRKTFSILGRGTAFMRSAATITPAKEMGTSLDYCDVNRTFSIFTITNRKRRTGSA